MSVRTPTKLSHEQTMGYASAQDPFINTNTEATGESSSQTDPFRFPIDFSIRIEQASRNGNE
jgi:hypothetical protein